MPDPTPPFISYSNNGEDVLLHRLFARQAAGFYVDVGAGHPLVGNDTVALYERGWSGINIEPSRSLFSAIARARPRDTNLCVTVTDHPVGTVTVPENPEDYDSRIEARALRHILEDVRPASVDLLRVDTSGLAPEAIRSNDWTRFRPSVVLVAATFPETPRRRPDQITSFLEPHGYRRVHFDGQNDYYVEHSFALPPGVFDRPPDRFDNFVPLAEFQLRNRCAELTTKAEALTREREHAQRAMRLANHASAARQVDLDRSLGEMVALRRTITALNTELEDSLRVARESTERLQTTHARIAELETTTASLTSQVAALTSQRAIDAAEQINLLRLRDSLSWRITRPLRALGRPGRTLRHVLGRMAE